MFFLMMLVTPSSTLTVTLFPHMWLFRSEIAQMLESAKLARQRAGGLRPVGHLHAEDLLKQAARDARVRRLAGDVDEVAAQHLQDERSEEHTSELQSIIRN